MERCRTRFVALSVLGAFLFGSSPPPVTAAASDITLLEKREIRPRLVELTLRTSALPEDTKVRVLLPDGYTESNKRRYPVIYLYHGGLGNAARYTLAPGNPTETLTSGLPVIVVMPDGGTAGYYTNWYNNGAFGPPEWDTYHMNQLIPWIDANYRTIPRRSTRATVGYSMGGHGSLAYAARHPDLIGSAASLSGSIDLNSPNLGIRQPAQQQSIAVQVFGAYLTEEVRYRGQNPWDLVANLANTDVSIYVGDTGNPEASLNVDAHNVHDRLVEFDIPHRFVVYPGFGHSDANYAKSFADWLPHVMDYFAGRAKRKSFTRDVPETFVYASIKHEYSIYDWTVEVQRSALEFSALKVEKKHFSVVGSGAAKVVTPSLGRSFALYHVKIDGPNGSPRRTIRADRNGRLAFTLDLGPSNPLQQYTAVADQASTGNSPDDVPFHARGNGSRFYRTTVSISP